MRGSIRRKKSKPVILDPLDVPTRLRELSKLQDGWLNGRGIALNRSHLLWFSDIFEENYDHSLPRPFLFPTAEGGLQAEWLIDVYSASMNIDLFKKIGVYTCPDPLSQDIDEAILDLNEIQGWKTLNQKLTVLTNKNNNESS